MKSPTDARRQARGTFTLALLLGALGLACWAYAPGLRGGFVLDDFANIVDNPLLHMTWSSGVAAWWHAAWSSSASMFHRPLSMLSFAIDWAVHPDNPQAMKAVSLRLHLLNGLLAYALVSGVLAWLPARRRPARLFAVLVAAAWLLAPINLVPTLYVVQRMEVLATLFVFAGLALYLHGRRISVCGLARHDGVVARRGHALSLAALLFGTGLGFLAKESAALLPVYALLAECLLVSPHACRLRTPDRHWTRAVFFATLVLPLVAGLAWLLPRLLSASAWANHGFTLTQRLLTESRVIMSYAWQTLVPHLRWLSLYHDDIALSTSWLSPPTTLAAILGLLALVGLVIAARRRFPLVSLGIGWFLAAQAMTATIIPLELAYEQRMYFASLGLLLAAFSLVWPWRMGGKQHRAGASGDWRTAAMPLGIVVLCLVVGCYALATRLRADAWSSPLRLAKTEVANHPASHRASYELGRLYYNLSLHAPPAQRLPLQIKSLRALLTAAHLPGASILPWQGVILLLDGPDHRNPNDLRAWRAIDMHLKRQPPTAEDATALLALARCATTHACSARPRDVADALALALAWPHQPASLVAPLTAASRVMALLATLPDPGQGVVPQTSPGQPHPSEGAH